MKLALAVTENTKRKIYNEFLIDIAFNLLAVKDKRFYVKKKIIFRSTDFGVDPFGWVRSTKKKLPRKWQL